MKNIQRNSIHRTMSVAHDEALAVVVLKGDNAHAMKGHHDLSGTLLANVGQALVTFKGDTPMIAQVVEQGLFALTIGDGAVIGLFGFGSTAHDALMQAAGKHIFIGHAVIDMPIAIVIGSLDRLLGRLGDIGLDHRLAVDVIDLERHALLGSAIHLSCRLDHINLLIAAHAGYIAIVLHADEQMAAAVVGKSGDRACDLAGIGNLVLEVLMLVLTLGNKVLYVMALLRSHFPGTLK